jgi:hypothetical protein
MAMMSHEVEAFPLFQSSMMARLILTRKFYENQPISLIKEKFYKPLLDLLRKVYSLDVSLLKVLALVMLHIVASSLIFAMSMHCYCRGVVLKDVGIPIFTNFPRYQH